MGVFRYGNQFQAKCAGRHLGTFDTPEQASEAYERAREEREGGGGQNH